ncbi:MAG: pilus assembly protein N-terminal domain-containing protein [Granulosicoccus sp.]|nr:pilus assembly protein N-terminal domain-containing protein [Granulosicoccus sp.]
MSRAAQSDGWFEITANTKEAGLNTPRTDKGQLVQQPSDLALSGMPDQLVAEPINGARDIEWVAKAGDDFPSIANAVTGSQDHAFTIARYNRHSLHTPIAAGTSVLVPAALAHDSFVREQHNVTVREQNTNKSSTSKSGNLNSKPHTSGDSTGKLLVNQPVTSNIDMFVGEIKVFGPVDVKRVANGNGNILRAEVIDSGELMIIAQAEGSSSIRLWHRDGSQSDYNVRVSSTDPETRVRRETMVRLRVRMVEFRKSALGKLGIDWSDGAAGPALAIAGDVSGNSLFRPESDDMFSALPTTVKPFSSYFGIASQISSRINFLASTGDATTLAEPVLSTINGGSASFLAGGEIPYPVTDGGGQTIVQFKEYGIKLNVSPQVDASGLIRTVVETEISQLDPAVSVQGAPGLLSRKAQTEVTVRSGETIVLSGLLSSESSTDIDKIPGIARLPVIGQFFRSRSARNAVNELVVFVTPEVINLSSTAQTRHEALIWSRSEQGLKQSRQKLLMVE